jgi:hypothetical protein
LSFKIIQIKYVRIKIIIIALKFNLKIDFWQGLGHASKDKLRLTRVNIKIKIFIIIVLKLDSGGRLESKPGSLVRKVNLG